MSIYRTLKPIAVSIENVVHSYRAGIFVDLDDDVDGTDVLVARGRIELVNASEGPELVDEPTSDEPKPLDKHTVPELLEIAKANGASEDSLKNLLKPQLIEAIERLTHVTED